MAKIAFLLGPSGVGKSFIGRRLEPVATVLTMDRIRTPTVMRMCPYLQKNIHHIRLWQTLADFCDMPAAISATMRLGKMLPSDDGESRIVAEGAGLWQQCFFDAFVEALAQSRVELDVQQFFLLMPTARQHLARIQKRANPDQNGWTEEHVEGQQKGYLKDVETNERIDNLTRYQDSDTLAKALADFFSVELPPKPKP